MKYFIKFLKRGKEKRKSNKIFLNKIKLRGEFLLVVLHGFEE